MRELKKKLLIGIDPDVHKSGFSMINNGSTIITNHTFFEIFDILKYYKEREVKPTVYIECGFLNNSNWHKIAGESSAINAKIGERTGANFEVAKKLCEMCEYLKIPYVQIKPTRHKVNAKEFKVLTGIKQRTNQDERDSFMLIFGR